MRLSTIAVLPAIALAAGSLLLSKPAQAQDTFSAGEREAIETIVRDYLLENPEILEEMFRALETKRNADMEKRMSEALQEFGPMLRNDEVAQVMGNPEGDVTLIEFFDYNCGVCRSEYANVQALIEANPDLKVLMWEWPVVRPPQSIDAARISLAVRDVAGREKWAEFHTAVMESDEIADRESILQIAAGLGIDRKAVEARLDSEGVVNHLQTSGSIGDALGFRGTPTFIIGDRVIAGGGQSETLQALIEQERQAQ